MIAYPKAEQTLTGQDGGAMIGGPSRTVWHTTETPSGVFYTANTYYHLQVRQDSDGIHWRQFIDLARASRALRHTEQTQTNRMGTYCPNVAIVGYAKDTPQLSEAMLSEIAEFAVWAEAELGIPNTWPLPFVGGEGYGLNSPARMTNTAWEAFGGNCGHQHVPQNTHWDPGKLPTIIPVTDHVHVPMPSELPRSWADNTWAEWVARSGTNDASRTWTFYREDLSWVYTRVIKPLEDELSKQAAEIEALKTQVASLTGSKGITQAQADQRYVKKGSTITLT